MLVSNYLEEEEEEDPPYNDPTSNICTEAALCLFFRYGPLHNQVVHRLQIIYNIKVGKTESVSINQSMNS